ncbi:glucose-6-phosphate isomerase [Lysinibacillus yapensis]|uniref:Glucose-6-phosphate isomerase n=1 Tax=Ureibacillus yapensis TaxID=2304605 RepID=A0A396SDY9_9BACL|nr:glucose-6-phosphate isomerase [Lysinibacillus yapensis]RHW39534.1 glucose-6-phosphate isomerase [Lysinibacillus yapensis]
MSHLQITTNFDDSRLEADALKYRASIPSIHRFLEEKVGEPTGWLDAPVEMTTDQIDRILNISNEIKRNADVLVVIGVGGSYLGAKAIQEALSPYFKKHENGIEVLYVGYNLSGTYIKQLVESLENREFYLNVISKSGSTMESSIAFRVLRQYTQERYGLKAAQRIIATTDSEKGVLREIAHAQGYRQFDIPKNIGGRYSTLTSVGLLPVAVSGIDILQLLEGAKRAAIELKEMNAEKNTAYLYAIYRNVLHSRGYQVELLASFEPGLRFIHEWWKQLFGESEGKDKKGLFPATVNYSTDLHSLGQYVQDGNPILFETFLHFKDVAEDFSIPYSLLDDDRLNYLSKKSFNEINQIYKKGTILAHSEGGVPIIQIDLKRLDAFHIGYLMYFFMKACAMSAYLLGVDPFDQPGVEAYKKKMTELLVVETTAN